MPPCEIAFALDRFIVGAGLILVISIGWVLALWNLHHDLADGKLAGIHGPRQQSQGDGSNPRPPSPES